MYKGEKTCSYLPYFLPHNKLYAVRRTV